MPAAKLICLVAAPTDKSVTLVPAEVLVKVTLALLLAPEAKPVSVPLNVPPVGLEGVAPDAALANALATCAAVIAAVAVKVKPPTVTVWPTAMSLKVTTDCSVTALAPCTIDTVGLEAGTVAE